MKNKNNSLIVAFALIAFLIVAMICIGVSEKNKNNPNNQNGDNYNNSEIVSNGEINSGEEYVFDEEANIIRDDEGKKINVSSEIKKDKLAFDFIELTNISLECINNESVFSADITNKSTSDYLNGLRIAILFYNDAGEEMAPPLEACTSSLPAGGKSNVKGKITMDVSNARTIDVLVRGEL